MNIVIPMAGRGARFATSGFDIPKPLIPVRGAPMIAWALKSLQGVLATQFIFVVLAEHEAKYGVTDLLQTLTQGQAKVVLIDEVTEGQLCTVLTARHLIDTEQGLLIASSDTYVVSNLARAVQHHAPACRGMISVANMPGDRWSFARTDASGQVVEVAEKVRISNHASTGLYYFASGQEFLQAADEIIQNQEKTQGEYYVIPVYQKYIQRGWRVEIMLSERMYDMGTPASLSEFLQTF